jgi:hypothetical protein
MKRRSIQQKPAETFAIVTTVGLGLPDVEATTKYDGSPVLKLGGCFMAGLATHPSAEPDTLVVRAGCEEREWLIEDAPETYYLTGLLSELSPRAGASVAYRTGRAARFAVRVMALDLGEGTKTRPTPTPHA